MNKKHRSTLLAVIATALLTLTTFTTAHAQSTLGDLIANSSSLISGDKVFTNWGFSGIGPLTANDINVVPMTDVNGNFGFRLQSGFFAGAGQTVDYLVTYRVTAAAPNQIIDLHLVFNGFALGAGSTANVVETATAPLGFVEQLAAFAVPSPGISDLSDDAQFPGQPQSFLDVSKDIFLHGGDGDNSFANISNIEQTFSQTGRQDGVPEPSTLALFGVGAGTLGFLAWRRKNRASAE